MTPNRALRLTGLLFLLLLATCGEQTTTGGDSGPCVTDEDCDAWEQCDGGVCVPREFSCSSDSDCDSWEICVGGVCVLPAIEPEPDAEADAEAEPLLPDIDAEPSSVDFGAARLGNPVERHLFVYNRGDAELHLQSLQIDQGNASVFEVDFFGELPLVVFPGEARELTLTYTQDDVLPDLGTLLIGSDDPDPEEAILRVPLFSSYKGQSALAVVDDPLAEAPEVTAVDFVDLPVGEQAGPRCSSRTWAAATRCW